MTLNSEVDPTATQVTVPIIPTDTGYILYRYIVY